MKVALILRCFSPSGELWAITIVHPILKLLSDPHG